MADLIDRQQALKELAAYIHLIDKTMGKGTLTDDDCMEAAKSVLGENELPAVQPEIIRCKDCDWWTKQEDSAQGRCELMQMYPAGGWYCGNARRRLE